MLKNYITTAINNLLKNKLYSAINIIGLSIGLAACIVIALYVMNQYSYDTQWENSDRIYRVNWEIKLPGNTSFKDPMIPMPVMPLLQEFFKDQIEKSTRAYLFPLLFDAGNSKFEDNVVLADPGFLDIFQIEEMAGSLKDTLAGPLNIALSEEIAKKYFGTEDPIGKSITGTIASFKLPFKITAVYRIPGNTVLDIPLMGSLLMEPYLPPSQKSWGSPNTGSYFLLKEGVDIETLKPFTPEFIDKHMSSFNPGRKASDGNFIYFQKLEEAHLNSPWDMGDTAKNNGNKEVVLAFAAIAVLVLLIGCINFTILTTAKATQRAREVAMRKVVGAKRKQLIIQFIGESILIVLMAMILSMGVVELILPMFESIMGVTLSINYTSPSTFLPLLGLLLLVGISGGMYPAFILSGFRPGNYLKANQSRETSGSMSLRTVLVIFQFSVSIVLIIATIVIYAQLRHSINRDPGYNKDNVLIISQNYLLYSGLSDNAKPLKNELLKLANITDVSVANRKPSTPGTTLYGFTRSDKPGATYPVPVIGVGYDFFDTYQIPFISGRNYADGRDIPEPVFDIGTNRPERDPENPPDRSIIINEKTAGKMGYRDAEEAVGKVIGTPEGDIKYTIIGVVADNHMFSINAAPRAEAYVLQPVQITNMVLRYKGPSQTILNQVKATCNKVMGDSEIQIEFVSQLVAKEFDQEQTSVKILVSFSLLAIIIACMGLFGSASFTVERRVKEIGLRKVMGAKVKNIVSLLLWQFSKPVLIANIIAWPIAMLAMQNWLERFAYRLNALYMIPICLASGLIALLIAWFTVAGNTSRVARTKPINSLRYE